MNSPFDDDFDYLVAGQALIEHLRTAVPELKRVVPEASLEDVMEAQLQTPAAAVVWPGDSLEEHVHNIQVQGVKQVWGVVLAVKAANDATGEKTHRQAGPLITRIIRAVRGWSPYEGFEDFVWVGQIEPTLSEGGLLYVPLFFETSFGL